VEAQPHLANLLQLSLESNLACHFQLHAVAVGDRKGEIDFWVPLDSSGSAGLFREHSASHEFRTIQVKLQRFDDLIRPENYAKDGVLKVDIEGSEYKFLEGARKTIQTLTPRMILEINPSTLRASHVSGENLKALLKELDYQYYAGLGNLENLRPLDQLDVEAHQNIVVFQDHHLAQA
jgi:FkbM family methyltransferase